jgi:hypothetical protein
MPPATRQRQPEAKLNMVKPAIESEAFKWDWMPFSFSPSYDLLELLKRRQNAYTDGKKAFPQRRSVMCQNCGSVLVIGKQREIGITISERYCDKECAQQDRSRVYRRDKTGNKTTFTKAVIKQSKTSIEIKQCGICGRKKAIKTGSVFRCGKKWIESQKQNKQHTNSNTKQLPNHKQNQTQNTCLGDCP